MIDRISSFSARRNWISCEVFWGGLGPDTGVGFNGLWYGCLAGAEFDEADVAIAGAAGGTDPDTSGDDGRNDVDMFAGTLGDPTRGEANAGSEAREGPGAFEVVPCATGGVVVPWATGGIVAPCAGGVIVPCAFALSAAARACFRFAFSMIMLYVVSAPGIAANQACRSAAVILKTSIHELIFAGALMGPVGEGRVPRAVGVLTLFGTTPGCTTHGG